MEAACTAPMWQPLINAAAVLIVAVTPGIAALLVALSNRQVIKRLPVKRASDLPDSGNGGNGGGGSHGST